MLQDKINFSRLIQGVMNWGAWGAKMTTAKMAKQIDAVLEMGVTTFDHADIYGGYTTEADFGKAFAETKVKRENVELISKLGIQYVGDERQKNRIKHYQYDATYIISNTEASLKKLKTDYLDLLLLHRPSPLMHPDEIKKGVEHLKSQGKIKDFGVSNFTNTQTSLVQKSLNVSVNQIQCSLTHFEPLLDGTLDKMITDNIITMAWSPLGVVFKEDIPQTQRILNVLESLGEKYSATKDQLLLAWLMQHPAKIYPVIGTTTLERVRLAVDAMSLQLELQDWFELLVASQGHKVP